MTSGFQSIGWTPIMSLLSLFCCVPSQYLDWPRKKSHGDKAATTNSLPIGNPTHTLNVDTYTKRSSVITWWLFMLPSMFLVATRQGVQMYNIMSSLYAVKDFWFEFAFSTMAACWLDVSIELSTTTLRSLSWFITSRPDSISVHVGGSFCPDAHYFALWLPVQPVWRALLEHLDLFWFIHPE